MRWALGRGRVGHPDREGKVGWDLGGGEGRGIRLEKERVGGL
jgi:hypothetical protein